MAEVQGPMAGTALRGPSSEERAVVMEKKTVVMEERVAVMEERRPQEPTESESEYGIVWHMLFGRVGEAGRKMPTGTCHHVSMFLKCFVAGSILDGSFIFVSASPQWSVSGCPPRREPLRGFLR